MGVFCEFYETSKITFFYRVFMGEYFWRKDKILINDIPEVDASFQSACDLCVP